jgi:hypothetical protein
LTIKSAQHTTAGARNQNSGARSCSAELFFNPAVLPRTPKPESRTPALLRRSAYASPPGIHSKRSEHW